MATEEVKEEVKKEDLQVQSIEPSLSVIFNRFYFSINTGCLLGYGDICPCEKYIYTKFLAMIQVNDNNITHFILIFILV